MVVPTESVDEDEAPPAVAVAAKEETTEELTADVVAPAEDTVIAQAGGNAVAEPPAEAVEEGPTVAADEEHVAVAGE